MKLDSLKKQKQNSVKKSQKTKERELQARKSVEEEEIESLRNRVTTEAPGIIINIIHITIIVVIIITHLIATNCK